MKSALFQDHTAIMLHQQHHNYAKVWEQKKQKQLNCVTKIIFLFELSLFIVLGLSSTAKADLTRLAILKSETSQWDGSAYHPLTPLRFLTVG